MPEPGENEQRDEFISRCIPIVMHEGTAENPDQAVAICNSIWREAHKTEEPEPDEEANKTLAVKAVGDWELEVLGVPFGGPNRGKDADGEYFTPRTNLFLDKFPTPLVTYYHGIDPSGHPQGDPEVIGEVKATDKRQDGVWYRVLLNKASQYAKRVWEAAQRGMAHASSGSILHLVRKAADGEILSWPVGEITLLDTDGQRRPANSYAVALPVMKAAYERAGIALPDIQLQPEAEEPEGKDKGDKQRSKPAPKAGGKSIANIAIKSEEIFDMDAEELKALLDKRDAEKAAAAKAAEEATAEAAKAEQVKIDAAITAAKKEWEDEAAKGRRLPDGKGTPAVIHSEFWKYDDLSVEDQAFLVGILGEAQKARLSRGPSEFALKSLAYKLAGDKTRVGIMGQNAMKTAGIKADEVMQQDLASYGDEWVGVSYSQSLWEAIRVGTFVAGKLPSIEVPQGMESIYIPIESTDPVFYKVAETTDHDATMLFPTASVTSSKVTTGRVQLTLAKMGARVPWSGELEEDSLIPFVGQLRAQIAKAGAEQFEHVIIDGDNATAATTNVNHIGGTPGATDLYLLFDGFRVSPLVTTTANSRDGGALTSADFLETVKLMGTAGINALDVTKVGFILDVNTHWKALELADVKTRDVYSQPTIEGGKLTGIWGYPVNVSANMHYKSSVRKANSAGKVDQTTVANNTTGSILAVRWDQWLLGYRRRMTLEVTRYPRSDSSEIVALMRVGLIQRDTEASAISYNITV